MIVIGGGVGPMAGVLLHRKIIENTRTNGTDQDHLEVMHLSRSPLIGDRTEFLEGKTVKDPVAGMLQVFRMAASGLASERESAVAGIPCNTFHASPIFTPFREMLESERLPLRVVNMIEETVEYVCRRVPGIGRVGLLSTTGTRESRVYADAFHARGIELVEIPPEEQPLLHEAIYHRQWGLKAVSPPDRRAVERVEQYARNILKQGAEALIPGCTELPLAIPGHVFEGVACVDPIGALARALVREVDPKKLKEENEEAP